MISEQIMLTGILVFFSGQVIRAGIKTKLQPYHETILTGISMAGFAVFLILILIKIWS